MKKLYSLVIIISILLLSCKRIAVNPLTFKKDFQGEWKKEGATQKAFTVKGDSMYYTGIKGGYYYELEQDTLVIHFSSRTTRSPLLEASQQKITIIDAAVSGDTLSLVKILE